MKNSIKKTISLLMAMLTILGTMSCAFVISLAADAVTEIESNNGSNEATQIPVDTDCIGWISNGKDIDWYKFNNDKDYFTLSFTVDKNKVDNDRIKKGWDIVVYTESGEKLKSYVGVKNSFETAILPISGTFMVKITSCWDDYDYAPINCEYSLKINTVTDDSWESEWNDSSAVANIINTDTMYYGTLHSEKDLDWYKVTTNKDYFNVYFNLEERTNLDEVEKGWDLLIYGDDGKKVIKHYTKITGELLTTNLPYAGTFYIKVIPYWADYDYAPIDCYYKFKVNTFTDNCWEDEINDASSQAMKVVSNKIYKGALQNAKDVDWFIFDNTLNAFNVNLKLDESSSYNDIEKGWKVTVYKYGSTESIVTYDKITAELNSFSIPYKGKMLIKVCASWADDSYAPVDCYYNLEITDHPSSELWEVEDNDSMDKATSILNKKTYNGNMENSKDIDYFKFRALYNGGMKLDFSRPISDKIGKGWKVSLLKADGTIVSENVVKDDMDTSICVNITKGEVYFVKVECKDTNSDRAPCYVDYSLKVTTSLKTANVSGLKSTATKDSVKLSWNKIAGVTGYKIYKYNSSTKKYTLVATTSKNSYTIKKLSPGTTYVYYVKAYQKYNDKDYLSSKYTKITTATKPDTPTLKATAGKKAATLNWSKETGTGYVVYMATSKNGTYSKVATVKGAAKVSYVKKNLTTGKTYYFKVRAYKTVGDQTLYGGYSAVKSVKVK